MQAALQSRDLSGADADRTGWQPLSMRLRAALADARFSEGRLDDAAAEAGALLVAAQGVDDRAAEAAASSALARVHWMRGDYEAMRLFSLRQCEALRAAGGAAREIAGAIGSLGLAEKSLGNYEEALARYREALAILRADGGEAEDPGVFVRLGNLLRTMGHVDESLSVLREGLAIARRASRPAAEPFLLTNLALAHETGGDLAAARVAVDEAVESARRFGELSIRAAALLCRARVVAERTAAGAASEIDAGADVRAAFTVWKALGSLPLAVQCVATAGLVLAQRPGEVPANGLALVLWAMTHPAFVRSEREDAQRRLDRLGIPPAVVERATTLLAADTSVDAVLRRLPAAWRP
jgi:tetratricopeptide (TPR) repeat protein